MRLHNMYAVLPGHRCLEPVKLSALVSQISPTACEACLDNLKEVQGKGLSLT